MSATSGQTGSPTNLASGRQPTDNESPASRADSEAAEANRRVQFDVSDDRGGQSLTDRMTAGSLGSARHRPTLRSWIDEEASLTVETRKLIAAAHVCKWSKRFSTKGLVESELRRLRVVSAPKPVPFLFLDSADSKVKVLHSFGRVTLEDRSNEGEGEFIGFLNDRRQTRHGGWKDPLPYRANSNKSDSFTMVATKTATQATCNKTNPDDWTTLLEAGSSAKTV